MVQASMVNMSKHMRLAGMLLFSDAVLDALKTKNSSMCVVHAAQAAEILLKARIADEHPLLIFSSIPKCNEYNQDLSLEYLLEKGRSLQYSDLPHQLWAATGVVIDDLALYKAFGSLRNQIIHTSITHAQEMSITTLKYAMEIIDPLVESFWGKSVVEFIVRDPIFQWEDPLSLSTIRCEPNYIIEKIEISPRLRPLLGQAAIDNWDLYKMNLRRDLNDWKNRDSQSIDLMVNDEDGQLDIYELNAKFREEELNQWESFKVSFMN